MNVHEQQQSSLGFACLEGISFLTVCTCSTALILALLGCASGGASDYQYTALPPSAGWQIVLHRDHASIPESITEDYQSYIRTLSISEREQLTKSSVSYFKDFNGQYAVKFTTYTKGMFADILWDHVLVYGTDNKRMEALRYKSGKSRS